VENADRHRSDPSTVSSRETGLAVSHILARTLFGIQHLHYGYWPPEMPVEVANVAAAQERYTEELISAIPDDVESILDVGCGPATNALRLLDRGYEVECVQPPGPLADLARQALAGRAPLHTTFFQSFSCERDYDLVLFSESLLFIRPLSEAISKAASLLREKGYLLICDIFRKPPPGSSEGSDSYHTGPIGGGHYARDFEAVMASQPLRLLENTDLSPGIAPTFDLIARVMGDIRPAYDLVMGKFAGRRPIATWLLRRVAKLDKYEKKHFRADRDGAAFLASKEYRRLLYQLDSDAHG